MKKIIIIFMLILILPLVSSLTFKQGENINFTFQCFDENGQYCSSTTQFVASAFRVNENSNLIFANRSLDYSGSVWNLTLPTSELGEYLITAFPIGNPNSTVELNYFVTVAGFQAKIPQSIVFLFLGIASMLFFGLSLFGAIKIKWNNPRSSTGLILGINDLKYVKLFLWIVSYLLLIFVVFAFRHISYVADWELGGVWFNSIFWFLIVFLFPVFVIIFTTGIIAWLGDKKTYNLISRGFKAR